MVDFFLVLMLAGAGDELQGIKKGVVELADMVAVNKADGDNRTRAELAAAEYRARAAPDAPGLAALDAAGGRLVSGLADLGLHELWEQIRVHREKMGATGELDERRRAQQVRWMWSMLDDRLPRRPADGPGRPTRLPASRRPSPRASSRPPWRRRRSSACWSRGRRRHHEFASTGAARHDIARRPRAPRRICAMSPPRLLVTGFGPYPKVRVNPTGVLALRLGGSRRLARLGVAVTAQVVETTDAAAGAAVPPLVARVDPDACLHLGLAPRERMVRIETRGENRTRSLSPDVRGKRPSRRALRPGAPKALREPRGRPSCSPA